MVSGVSVGCFDVFLYDCMQVGTVLHIFSCFVSGQQAIVVGIVRGFIKRKCHSYEGSFDMLKSKLNYGHVESRKGITLNSILLVLGSILGDDGNYL